MSNIIYWLILKNNLDNSLTEIDPYASALTRIHKTPDWHMCVNKASLVKNKKRNWSGKIFFFFLANKKKDFLNSVKLRQPSDALPLTVKERKEADWKETISPGWPASHMFVGIKKKERDSQILASDAKCYI